MNRSHLTCLLGITGLLLACGSRPGSRIAGPGGDGDGGATGAGGHAGEIGAGGGIPAGGGSGGAGEDLVLSTGEACLDFGRVMLGLDRTMPLEIRNLSGASGPVTLSVLDSAFRVKPGRVDLGAHATATVEVRFFPPARGRYEAALELRTCPGCTPLLHCLSGFAAVESFEIQPSPLEFGTHLPGTTTCETITIRNTGDVPIFARDIRTDDGLKRVSGSFELRLGGILNNEEIPPGGEGAFELCFTPKRLGESYRGNVIVYTDNQVTKVGVTGRGGGAMLVAVPERLDLGEVCSGSTVARWFLLTNHGEPVASYVTAVEWTPQDGTLDVSFPELPFNPGEEGDYPIEVEVTPRAPGAFAGEVVLHLGSGASETRVVVPVTATVVECTR